LFKTANSIIPVDQNLIAKIKEEAKNAADREFAVADVLYKAAADFWEKKEQEMGREVFEGAQRFVALQSLDNLWMEHLDTMDHLRDSVRLRGYGQRDPLVEYKKEGHLMFQRLTAEINKQIVFTIFHISVQAKPQQQVQPMNLNLSSQSANQSISESADKSVGRNEPCPCGSGKKWKKCGMINSQEHQTNISKTNH